MCSQWHSWGMCCSGSHKNFTPTHNNEIKIDWYWLMITSNKHFVVIQELINCKFQKTCKSWSTSSLRASLSLATLPHFSRSPHVLALNCIQIKEKEDRGECIPGPSQSNSFSGRLYVNDPEQTMIGKLLEWWKPAEERGVCAGETRMKTSDSCNAFRHDYANDSAQFLSYTRVWCGHALESALGRYTPRHWRSILTAHRCCGLVAVMRRGRKEMGKHPPTDLPNSK